jgi:hypothetical protein
MPPDPAHGAHVLVEFLAAIVLIAGGLVVLGLAWRRRMLGQPSPVVIVVPEQPASSAARGLRVVAGSLALAGAVIALGPGGPSLVGVLFGGLAVVLLRVLRFALPRLDRAGLLRLRTALSIGLVPIVTLAVIAVVVVFASPSGAATIHH